MSETSKLEEHQDIYAPDEKESKAIREVLDTFDKGRSILNKGYNYFNGRSLFEAINDWTKRWNGYIPPMNPLLDQTQSQIFVNFTRNAIISYLAKVAMSGVKSKIKAVNKKTGLPNQQFAQILKDLNQYSLNNENAEAKFLATGMECAVKGTVVVYEGYMKSEQDTDIPTDFDAVTGKVTYKKGTRTLFDDCYQEIVPLEDFCITNAFQADVQKQPKIIWKRLTTKEEAESEFGHYKNWKFVQPGRYVVASDVTTFYRETILTDLGSNQVEILRYYCRSKNRHIIMVNGVVLYDGPIPFKDGRYPFAKNVNEPFANDFFWGNGHPGKYMGEQDLINSFINMMADKTFNSLAVTGLSSDLDDLIEDDTIQIGKFRKVSDIEKWKWWPAPEVTSGEQSMFQNILGLAKESASTDAGNTYSPKGGKVQSRQLAIKQQEMMQKLSFNMTFLEDLERDRTILRIAHLLQFYSIPKVEKITGKKGKEVEQMVFRDINLTDTKLSDGRQGTKIIKIIGNGEHKNSDDRQKLADSLSLTEVQGEEQGIPTEALAVSTDTFNDFNYSVQVIKNSSFEKNQALDQAMAFEYANWRVQFAQMAGQMGSPYPTDMKALGDWVGEKFDVDQSQFEPKQAQQPPGTPPGGQPPQAIPNGGVSAQLSPSKMGVSQMLQ